MSEADDEFFDHRDDTRDPFDDVEPGPGPCPICEFPMVLRENCRTGQKFYGCMSYPQCTGTRPAREE